MNRPAARSTAAADAPGSEGLTIGSAAGRPWRIFYSYTSWSVLLVFVVLPLGLLMVLGERVPDLIDAHPLAMGLVGVQVLAALWSVDRSLRAWGRRSTPVERGRWDLPQVGWLPLDAWVIPVVVPAVVLLVAQLAGAAVPVPLLLSLGVLIAVVAGRMPLPVGILVALLMAVVAAVLGFPLAESLPAASITLAAVGTLRSSLWLAAVVRELDEARTAQSRLAVAEERLRFARDLHDVTGRDLSAIAVTAELAAQLAEREDPRAATQAREVAGIARGSLATMRGLVRGYREADLATELQGTVSLLRAARAQVEVVGDPADVDPEHAQRLAWALREGGTNVLRHASATRVRIELRRDRLTLTNDGAARDLVIAEGSGLRGMRERLGEDAEVSVHAEGGTVVLDVSLPPRGSTLERAGAPGGTVPAAPTTQKTEKTERTQP